MDERVIVKMHLWKCKIKMKRVVMKIELKKMENGENEF